MSKKKVHILAILTFLMNVSIAFSQNIELQKLNNKINNDDFSTTETELKKINSPKLSITDKPLYYLLCAKNYGHENKNDLAFQYFHKAKEDYLKINNVDSAMEVNLKLSYLVDAQKNNPNEAQKYIIEYINYAKKTNNQRKLVKAYSQVASMNIDSIHYNKSLYYFRKALQLNKKVKNEKIQSSLNNNIAVLFSEILNQPDSSLYYLKNDLKYLTKKKINIEICYNYMNQASAYSHLGNKKEAIKYWLLADKVKIDKFTNSIKSNIYSFLSLDYQSVKDYEKAVYYLNLSNKYSESNTIEKQNIAINEIQTKYNTQKKELENLNLKTKNKEKMLWIYTCIGLIIVGFIIAYLKVKNLKKKEQIAIQDKELQNERYENALKEHEIDSIESMIKGQEQERIKLANDLHDNLGSMLVTLKLNFHNLKERRDTIKAEEDRLFEKTDALIEEAYQKVRTIAHTKNAGVIASEGLVPAIKNISKKISIPGVLQIEVFAFGMEERLDGTLEISIFRMIQEIVTNIVKHSEANYATISLTQHEDTLNIMIEDNGKGFDFKSTINNGIGLSNIQKKIEFMNGSFSIDSYKNKGTTIIIDLPL
ncbi:ATP-binding protein [Flavobacterium sp. SUN052]|uniref:ATP-binding protein n=1 Tax=Flavobacterium sp. SUN052 TaxID=3002441 RepID=UPI00237DB00D|nr:ATP-binding protein [Flavobacterium sp. SUN052]MEC4005301.1 ATP-binding protein [Flavobacterium sp. SUN052]